MATRYIKEEDLEIYFQKIIKREESIRSLAIKTDIPRNTLARKIKQRFEKDTRYEQYEEIVNRNQHSGGKLEVEGKEIAIGENLEKLKVFFEEYSSYKRQGLLDKQIIEAMHTKKATFYRKIGYYKRSILNGELKVAKKEFVMYPEDIKREILYKKLNEEREKAKCKTITKKQFSGKIEKIMDYFLVERNENIKEKTCLINQEDVYAILFSNTKIIGFDMDKNIKPSVENIDRIIGKQLSNLLIKNKPNVFSLCKEKVEELLCLAIDEGYLKTYLKSDDRWTSGERMYAVIQYAKEQDKTHNQLNWLNKKISEKYDKEILIKKYPYPEKYRRIGEKPIKGQQYDNDDWEL